MLNPMTNTLALCDLFCFLISTIETQTALFRKQKTLILVHRLSLFQSVSFRSARELDLDCHICDPYLLPSYTVWTLHPLTCTIEFRSSLSFFLLSGFWLTDAHTYMHSYFESPYTVPVLDCEHWCRHNQSIDESHLPCCTVCYPNQPVPLTPFSPFPSAPTFVQTPGWMSRAYTRVIIIII